MSLESIVFSSKHFQDDNEQSKKNQPVEKQPAWMDPDDLALVINPKLKNMPPSLENKPKEEIQHVLREKFNETVHHIDTSWGDVSNQKEVADTSDLFSDIKNKIPSDILVITRVADLYTPKDYKASILQLAFNPAEPRASILDSKGCLHIVSTNNDVLSIGCIALAKPRLLFWKRK